jgi:hypothetical protein
VKTAAAKRAVRPVAGGRTAALRDGPHVSDTRVLALLRTFPDMSYRPSWLGAFRATSWM